jgi:hypothetical protein
LREQHQARAVGQLQLGAVDELEGARGSVFLAQLLQGKMGAHAAGE